MIPPGTIKHFLIATVDNYAFPFAPFAPLVHLE